MTTRPAERRRTSAAPVLRIVGALTAVLLSALVTTPVDGPPLRGMLLAAALLMLPLDLLPVIMIVTVRNTEAVVGPLTASDVVALGYLARLTAGLGFLRIRLTRSRVALVLFLIWAAVATALGIGLYTALAHIALYAVVGMAATRRRRARTYLLVGVVGFALMDIVWYLPSFPGRLWGVLVRDPTHAGVLLIAALLVVCAAPLRTAVRIPLGGCLLFGILMTLTRSVWFATGAVAIAALLPRRWYVPLLLPPVLAVLTLPLVAGVTSRFDLNPHSRQLRQESMAIGLQAFERNPFFGRGWAFTSAAREFGLVGVDNSPTYNLWIYLGACVGLVGIALFAVFIALLGREAIGDPVAYLFLVGALATSLTEMHFYACSLTALLFFTLTSTVPGRSSAPPAQDLARSLAATSAHRSRATANTLGGMDSGSGAGLRRPAPGS